MGCDIHMHVCVADGNTGKLKPVYVVGNTTGDIKLKTYEPGGYFRNYDVFGLLNECVRGGCWISDVSLPPRGRLPFERLDLGNYTFDQLTNDVKRIESNLAHSADPQDSEYNGYLESRNDLERGISNPYPRFVADYYYSQWYHSHTYFTVAELMKLIKRLKKYRKKVGKNVVYDDPDYRVDTEMMEMQNEIDSYIATIKDIINDARTLAKIASEMYEQPIDEDIYILCCFDS